MSGSAPRARDAWRGPLSGTVLATERLGSDTFAHVEVEGAERPVMVRLPGDARLAPNSEVRLGFDADTLYAFDAKGRALPRTAMRSAS